MFDDDDDKGDLFVDPPAADAAVVAAADCEIGFFVAGVGVDIVDLFAPTPVFGAFQENNLTEFEKFLTVETDVAEMEGNLERQIIFFFF